MPYSVKLTQFEGPLDLLLDIIEQEKLDISQISLATVTEGYLQYLDGNPNIPLEELVDFLVVASKLLFIKSRLLLPFLNPPVGEEEQALEAQLRIYKEYLEASKVIDALVGKRRFLFVHEKLPKVDIGFAPPESFGIDDMQAFMEAAVKRLEPLVKVPRAIIEKTVSIHEKIVEIRGILDQTKTTSFRHMLLTARNRTEIVVTFLALLELVKQRTVTVRQDKLFEDIILENGPSADVQS